MIAALNFPVQQPEAPLCRHCHAKPGTRSRQLCSECYYARDENGRFWIREQYPSTSPMGNRQNVLHDFLAIRARNDRRRTETEPGSEARIRIYRDRAERQQDLFLDAKGNRLDEKPEVFTFRWRDNAVQMEPGERLLYLMRRASVDNPTQLAAMSDVSEETIRAFLRGKKTLVYLDATRIAEVLDVERELIVKV